jgi:hypothetical protein
MLLQHLQAHVKKKMADRTNKIDRAFTEGTKESMERFGTFTSALETGMWVLLSEGNDRWFVLSVRGTSDAHVGQLKHKLEDVEEYTAGLVKKQRTEYEKCQVRLR